MNARATMSAPLPAVTAELLLSLHQHRLLSTRQALEMHMAGRSIRWAERVLSTLAGDVQGVDTTTVTPGTGAIELSFSGLAVGTAYAAEAARRQEEAKAVEEPVRQGLTIVRTATTSTARSTDPRLRILDAMIETVAHRGYDRTTLDRVQGVAKVPAPVFDEHFENKQDCFLQALDEFVGRLECIVLERLRRRPRARGRRCPEQSCSG